MYLKDFIRVQLSEDDIRNLVTEFVQSTPTAKMGDVMKMLKDKYPGQYDGKVASKITMSVLSK